ncbi:MAG: M23 family metallopeptidase [Rickettsiales bacterium]|nr:M23 family metallopeptidase [Rickettsiales bacterium]
MKKLLAFLSDVRCGLVLCILLCMHAGAGSGDFSSDKKCKISGDKPNAPKACGAAWQGGMLYGRADGMEVFYDGKKISLNDVFVVGFGRDAPDTVKLSFCKTGCKDCKDYSYAIEKRKYREQEIKVPDKYTEYPPEIEKRIARENAEIAAARSGAAADTATYFMNLRLPENLHDIRISGVYGSGRKFNGQVKSPHKGVDWAAPTGTLVYSFAPGRVVLAADHYMNGKIVIIAHGHDITTSYLHFSKINVKVGDKVGYDTVIGEVGGTGRASGPHLHAQLNWGSVAIDLGLFVLGEKKSDEK